MTRLFLFISALWTGFGPSAASAEQVTVFAAASLRGVLEEVARSYTAQISLSFGGSGTMARQIAAGAPADLVILANTDWMTWLEGQGVVAPDTSVAIAANALVLIAPAQEGPLTAVSDIPALLGQNRLAMGQRDAVPAGIYARQWLTSAGLWDTLRDQLAETDNVRAALALVARGEAPLGLVYASDAAAEARVTVLYHVPSHAHDPILYPAAALTPAGVTLLAHLRGTAVQTIFTAHGFQPVAQ